MEHPWQQQHDVPSDQKDPSDQKELSQELVDMHRRFNEHDEMDCDIGPTGFSNTDYGQQTGYMDLPNFNPNNLRQDEHFFIVDLARAAKLEAQRLFEEQGDSRFPFVHSDADAPYKGQYEYHVAYNGHVYQIKFASNHSTVVEFKKVKVLAPQPLKPEVAKEGYMSLKTDFSGCFEMRYFKLWTNTLRMEYFHKDPMNEEPHYVDLSEMIAMPQRVDKTQFAVLTSSRKWEFQCMTETRVDSWIEAILKVNKMCN